MKCARSLLAAAVLTVAFLLGAVAAGAEPLPVEPGNATPGQFEPSQNCSCHRTLVEQWLESMHAKALTDPIFNVKLDEAQKATDGVVGAFCLKCHGPIATMTGEIGSDSMSPAASQAVTCMFCHQVAGLAPGTPGNTSHLVEASGTRRAQIQDPESPHATAYSELHTTAEFCGGCHNVDHPVSGAHLEATYTEWANSSYAQEGVVCQDCHMSRKPGEVGPDSTQACAGGPQRDNIYHMSFVGAQVELGSSDGATAMLKSAATVSVEAPNVVAPGSEVTVTVSTLNKGAGHYLPTGLTEVRQMWLEVYAEDPQGGKTPLGEHRFGTVLQDEEGNAPAEPWEAASIKSDDRIPPRKSVKDSFAFSMPATGDQAKVVAVLRYQSVPEDLAEKAKVANPVTTMASGEALVFSTEEARAAFAATNEPAEEPGSSWGLGTILVLSGVLAVAALVLIVGRRVSGRG